MTPYLQQTSNNIASQIQRIALPFEHYIAGEFCGHVYNSVNRSHVL